MRRASWISFGIIVTRLAWIAHRFVSSKRPTRYDSEASCSARMAVDWKRRSVLKSCAISRTSRWKGSLRMSNSVLFWYLRISLKATVPGLFGNKMSQMMNMFCRRYRPSGNAHDQIGLVQVESVGLCIVAISSPVAVGLLYTTRGRRALACRLGSKLLAGRLAASRLSGSLFGTAEYQFVTFT